MCFHYGGISSGENPPHLKKFSGLAGFGRFLSFAVALHVYLGLQALQWLFISATGAARRSPVCKGSFKLQCETNLHPDLLGDLQSASRAVALRDLRPA